MNNAQHHHFRIQVERVDDATSAPLVFEVIHHDDIFAMVERVHAGTAFAASDATALAVGLKLFTGVMLNQPNDPLFADVQPVMRVFIGNLKSRIAATMQKRNNA
ncbi:DUF3861 domain-containing protein [Dyella monticola]|nr:DUF3861 domain-containing protein [Dyella monticola]